MQHVHVHVHVCDIQTVNIPWTHGKASIKMLIVYHLHVHVHVLESLFTFTMTSKLDVSCTIVYSLMS